MCNVKVQFTVRYQKCIPPPPPVSLLRDEMLQEMLQNFQTSQRKKNPPDCTVCLPPPPLLPPPPQPNYFWCYSSGASLLVIFPGVPFLMWTLLHHVLLCHTDLLVKMGVFKLLVLLNMICLCKYVTIFNYGQF